MRCGDFSSLGLIFLLHLSVTFILSRLLTWSFGGGTALLPRSISRSDCLYGYSLSLCELVLCLFCFILFLFYFLARIPVPSTGRLPGSCLYASWCPRPWLVCFVLFCFVLFLLVRIPVPPSGRLPAPLHREAGGARIPIFIFVLRFIFHLA